MEFNSGFKGLNIDRKTRGILVRIPAKATRATLLQRFQTKSRTIQPNNQLFRGR